MEWGHSAWPMRCPAAAVMARVGTRVRRLGAGAAAGRQGGARCPGRFPEQPRLESSRAIAGSRQASGYSDAGVGRDAKAVQGGLPPAGITPPFQSCRAGQGSAPLPCVQPPPKRGVWFEMSCAHGPPARGVRTVTSKSLVGLQHRSAAASTLSSLATAAEQPGRCWPSPSCDGQSYSEPQGVSPLPLVPACPSSSSKSGDRMPELLGSWSEVASGCMRGRGPQKTHESQHRRSRDEACTLPLPTTPRSNLWAPAAPHGAAQACLRAREPPMRRPRAAACPPRQQARGSSRAARAALSSRALSAHNSALTSPVRMAAVAPSAAPLKCSELILRWGSRTAARPAAYAGEGGAAACGRSIEGIGAAARAGITGGSESLRPASCCRLDHAKLTLSGRGVCGHNACLLTGFVNLRN